MRSGGRRRPRPSTSEQPLDRLADGPRSARDARDPVRHPADLADRVGRGQGEPDPAQERHIGEIVPHERDLRRQHLREGSILGLRARDCMTRNPKVIGAGELAARALEMMESFAITSLAIVGAAEKPVGLIHLHDILRAKIV